MYMCHQVLCPLVNVPMIDYTMEFLARNDVREVFVFCVSHGKQLEEYLQSSTWAAHMEVRYAYGLGSLLVDRGQMLGFGLMSQVRAACATTKGACRVRVSFPCVLMKTSGEKI